MASPWVRWRDDVFGDPYMVWHEGPDFTRLLKLAPTAPAEVASMLATGLDARDPVAAQSVTALADAGLTPADAETLLRAAARDATDTFLVRVAQALHVLTDDESWAARIATVLTSNAFWGVRIDAAIALAGFTPTPELIEKLGEGVRDEEYLVRYHSANTLLRYAGRKKDVSDYRTLFDKIVTPGEGETTDAVRASWREAADKLTAGALRAL